MRVVLLLVDTRFQVGILRVRQERSAAYLLDPMASTPAPSASKSFGSEVTAAYVTRFGDHFARRTSSGRHAAGHGSPAEMVNSNSFQSWQNRVMQLIGACIREAASRSAA